MIRYYFSTLTGDGTRRNSYRPKYATYGSYRWGVFDLKPDRKDASGYCISCADTVNPITGDAEVKLIASDIISIVSNRTAIQTALGISLTANKNLPDMILEIISKLGLKLEPHSDGKTRLFLGGQIYGDPPPAVGKGSIHDTFNRSNSEDLGTSSEGGWAWVEKTGDFHIASAKAAAQSGADCYAYADTATPSSANQYAQANVWVSGGGDAAWLCVQGATSAFTCFVGGTNQGDGCWMLKSVSGGSYGDIDYNPSGWATPNGALLYLEINGTSLTLKQAGVTKVGPATVTAKATVHAGIASWDGGTAQFQNFEAGNLGGATVYYQNVGGALTSASTLNRLTARRTGGEITSSSSLNRKTYKSTGGGSVGIAGALGAIFKRFASVGAGAVGIASTLSRLIAKNVGGGAISVAGVVNRLIFKSVGNGALSIASTLNRLIAVGVGGSLTAASTLGRNIIVTVGSGALSLSGALDVLLVGITKYYQAVGNGALTVVGTLNLLIKRAVGSGVTSISGAVGRLSKIAVGAGSVTIAGVLGRLILKSVGGSLGIASTLNRLIKKGVGAGSIGLSGALTALIVVAGRYYQNVGGGAVSIASTLGHILKLRNILHRASTDLHNLGKTLHVHSLGSMLSKYTLGRKRKERDE